MKCPHCNENIDVRFIKAPSDAQPKPAGGAPASGDVGELLEACEGQPMTTWEETFVTEQKARFTQYGSRTRISDKQLNILRKIANGEGGRSREDEF